MASVSSSSSSRTSALGVLNTRIGPAYLIIAIFIALANIVRTVLLGASFGQTDHRIWPLIKVYLYAVPYDLAAAIYFVLPFALYQILVPDRIHRWRLHRWAMAALFFALLYVIVFSGCAEWFFWDEFGERFNFIAVDYLVYTQEVIGNINQSYPMPLIIGGELLLTTGIFWLVTRKKLLTFDHAGKTTMLRRLAYALPILAAAGLFTAGLSRDTLAPSANVYNNQLAMNGVYSLFSAFRHNDLDYARYYQTEDGQLAYRTVRAGIVTPETDFLSASPDDLRHIIRRRGPERDYNIVMVVVESLSGVYMDTLGGNGHLTPNLDRLAGESLFFDNFYATGNRTDRGLEAITLSLPPSPGQSVIKRSYDVDLDTLGEILGKRGYQREFLYGGYAYFDNMSHFFGYHGFDVVDRSDFKDSEKTFATIWGQCDEDLFSKALSEGDAMAARGKPFLQMMVTTSNHRPYDYPEGRIDIPSHTGRNGAVKYTDYAIGQYIERAKGKAWFKDTLFVIVADHCGSSAGKVKVPSDNYHIPLFIYNPGIVGARRISTLASQIDVAPTLLGIMNVTYESEYFGKDMLGMKPSEGRAFIANYENLGLMKGQTVYLLSPMKRASYHPVKGAPQRVLTQAEETTMRAETVSFYETVSSLIQRRIHRAR